MSYFETLENNAYSIEFQRLCAVFSSLCSQYEKAGMTYTALTVGMTPYTLIGGNGCTIPLFNDHHCKFIKALYEGNMSYARDMLALTPTVAFSSYYVIDYGMGHACDLKCESRIPVEYLFADTDTIVGRELQRIEAFVQASKPKMR